MCLVIFYKVFIIIIALFTYFAAKYLINYYLSLICYIYYESITTNHLLLHYKYNMNTIIIMRPKPFEIISEKNEIQAHGSIIPNRKYIIEWTRPNQLEMIWENFTEMEVVSK